MLLSALLRISMSCGVRERGKRTAGKVRLLPDWRSLHGGLVKCHGRLSAGSCKSSWATKGPVRLVITLDFPGRKTEKQVGYLPGIEAWLEVGSFLSKIRGGGKIPLPPGISRF